LRPELDLLHGSNLARHVRDGHGRRGLADNLGAIGERFAALAPGEPADGGGAAEREQRQHRRPETRGGGDEVARRNLLPGG
jgi:hypothetical protein